MLKPISKVIWMLSLILFPFTGKVFAQTALIRKEQVKLPFCKDSIARVNLLNRVGMLYHEKNIDSCFFYGMKAKTLSAKIHYAKGETDAENVIAISLVLKGLFKESLELFNKALKGYRQQADTVNIAQVLMNMGLTYHLVRDTLKSNAFYREAMATAGGMRQDSILSMIYLNYYGSNSETLSKDSAEYYLDNSQAIAQRYKDDRVLTSNKEVRAYLMIQTNRRPEALSLIKQALDKSRKDGNEFLEINALGQYGQYYWNTPDSVLKYYGLAYKLIEKDGYTLYKNRILSGILQKTELIGNKDSIIRVHGLMEAALGEENENLRKFIGDYIKYNTIQTDNSLLSISNSNKQTQIWLLIALCSLCGLLVIFIYRQYKVFRHLHKTVSEQNSHLQKALAALEQSQADNTQMMKIVAHDLRNPIGGIYSIVSLMLAEEGLNDDQRMMLELVKTSGQNSLDLVSDLLQVHTKAEQLKKEPVDLRQLLHYCVNLLQPKAEAKGQHIELSAPSMVITISREKMWRVISNLIANAVKFSPTGATILVRLISEPGNIRIEVADHGIGIPEDMKEKIFDMFTGAKRTGTAGEEPFGMGLAISKQIVEAHGGTIWYESSSGEGTTFFVELPE